jgi:hypothetical protein
LTLKTIGGEDKSLGRDLCGWPAGEQEPPAGDTGRRQPGSSGGDGMGGARTRRRGRHAEGTARGVEPEVAADAGRPIVRRSARQPLYACVMLRSIKRVNGEPGDKVPILIAQGDGGGDDAYAMLDRMVRIDPCEPGRAAQTPLFREKGKPLTTEALRSHAKRTWQAAGQSGLLHVNVTCCDTSRLDACALPMQPTHCGNDSLCQSRRMHVVSPSRVCITTIHVVPRVAQVTPNTDGSERIATA